MNTPNQPTPKRPVGRPRGADLDELEKEVGVTRRRIRQMLAANRIAFKKIGRQYLITGSAVAAFVETFEPSNRGRQRTTTPKAKPKKRR